MQTDQYEQPDDDNEVTELLIEHDAHEQPQRRDKRQAKQHRQPEMVQSLPVIR